MYVCALPCSAAVFALIALHEEVKDRDPEWQGAMANWPVQSCHVNGTCDIDPCGTPPLLQQAA